ncbi:MAG: bifunctional adenosylcobinamide kinase/adenosylcobinamide-phosphate guanylyltransferase [Dehalococcoidia bacterium]|nr:bifunctional adenosylcobinamide kinase/adenosylcobinamide-phosphate guanylyltransferase [Dehalococcoidia bacterium]
MGSIHLVTGGARNGKSRHAEALAAASGAPVVYIATMEPGDEELRARIARHRERRPADWATIEAPRDLTWALAAAPTGAAVLLDCLSLWVSNQLFADGDPAAWGTARWERFVDGCVADAETLITAQAGRDGPLIAVTNEVGLGIVPVDALSRYYRDALGLVNQAFARAASEATFMVSGLPLRLK